MTPDEARRRKAYREAETAQFAATAQDSPEAAVAMTAGWTRRQLIDVALTLAVKPPILHIGARYPDDPNGWTDESLKAYHAAWNAGYRSPRIKEGERVYQRLRWQRRHAS